MTKKPVTVDNNDLNKTQYEYGKVYGTVWMVVQGKGKRPMATETIENTEATFTQNQIYILIDQNNNNNRI